MGVGGVEEMVGGGGMVGDAGEGEGEGEAVAQMMQLLQLQLEPPRQQHLQHLHLRDQSEWQPAMMDSRR